VLAVMTLVVAAHIMTVVPESTSIRLFVYPIANIAYRIRAGQGNVPLDAGRSLFRTNIFVRGRHTAHGRPAAPVHFLMLKKYYTRRS